MISYCTDARHVIVSLCPHDMTGNTDWTLADSRFNLTMSDELYDGKGAALYKIDGGVAAMRSEEERMADWQPEPEAEATDKDYQNALAQLGVEI